MSLDLFLKCPACNQDAENADINITYNLSQMWREAGGSDVFIDIEGKTGAEAISIVVPILTELLSNRDHYEKFNPPNNWGSYEGLVRILRRIRDAGESHPNLIWGACR